MQEGLAQVKEVMLLEEEKENSRRDQRGSQPLRTAKQIVNIRDRPPPLKEPAWKLMDRRFGRGRQQADWLPAEASRQQRNHVTSVMSR